MFFLAFSSTEGTSLPDTRFASSAANDSRRRTIAKISSICADEGSLSATEDAFAGASGAGAASAAGDGATGGDDSEGESTFVGTIVADIDERCRISR